MFVKLKIEFFSTMAMQLLVLIFFVSIALAQEDGKSESQPNKNASNTTNEERYRSAGIIFPSLEEIRESFKRFQDHINNFRRNGGGAGHSTTSDPRQHQNLSNSNLNSNGNYFRNSNSNFHGSGNFPGGDDSENIYPPGFRRPNPNTNTYYKTSTTSSSADLQHHTTTTIYIICVCLIIMVVGSILFICVNKCQEPSIPNSSTSNSHRNGSRSRTNNLSSESSSIRNSRISVSTISIAVPGDESPSGSSSVSNIPGANIDFDSKFRYDLPPSYDSLFPIGK